MVRKEQTDRLGQTHRADVFRVCRIPAVLTQRGEDTLGDFDRGQAIFTRDTRAFDGLYAIDEFTQLRRQLVLRSAIDRQQFQMPGE